ncbi:MAG: ABC-2 transporter permease [bacterium]
MLILWIGLPIVSVLTHLLLPDTGEEIPFSLLTATMLSSIGGSLAAIMLTVYLIHEKTRNVYQLFLIRPVKRKHIILAKYLAVFICVTFACGLALLLGVGLDYIYSDGIPKIIIEQTLISFAQTLSSVALACALGVLVGVSVPSVLVGVIIIIFVANNIASFTLLLPTMLELRNPFIITIILGVILTIVFLSASLSVFERKQF